MCYFYKNNSSYQTLIFVYGKKGKINKLTEPIGYFSTPLPHYEVFGIGKYRNQVAGRVK